MTRLYEPCPRCDGSGKQGSRFGVMAQATCGNCLGQRYALTDLTTEDVSMLKGAVQRLEGQLAETERERDALTAAIDRHVSESVGEKYESAPAWVIRGDVMMAYYTRAEAEAAYRRMTGLGLDAWTEAPADGPCE